MTNSFTFYRWRSQESWRRQSRSRWRWRWRGYERRQSKRCIDWIFMFLL